MGYKQTMKCLHVVSILMLGSSVLADWAFSWDSRLDLNGYPVGAYASTPFPLTEASTTYTNTTDEGSTVYLLGSVYYVDGAAVSDTGDGSFENPFKTLTHALADHSTGNKTILVRGAHDSFDGVYQCGSYSIPYGLNNTQRFTIAGYGQERPVLDGTNSTSLMFGGYGTNGTTNLFVTLQRLRIINGGREVIGVGADSDTYKVGRYLNCIDLLCQTNTTSMVANGNIYYLNADYGYVSHCSLERSGGHGIKIGDGASHCIVEWCSVTENGYWEGRTNNANRSVGLDFPSDRDIATNNICRYNVMNVCLSHGLQLRRQHGFIVHHNEITGWGRGIGFIDMSGVVPFGVLISSTSWGSFYGNIVHNGYTGNTNSSMVYVQSDSLSVDVSMWNNVIYDVTGNELDSVYLANANSPNVYLSNNTIVQSNSLACVRMRTASGTPVYGFTNNVFIQMGSGSPIAKVDYTSPPTPAKAYNCYYHPNGSAGYLGEDGTGEMVADPLLVSYKPTGLSPLVSAGVVLSAFADDANGLARGSVWDIGAYEYFPLAPPFRAGRWKGVTP